MEGEIAITVEQREAALRLLLEHGLDDRDHRRDAGTARQRDIIGRWIAAFRRHETAERRQHLDFRARLQRDVRPGRERPPGICFTAMRISFSCGATQTE